VSLIGDRISLWQSVERAGDGASTLAGGFGFIQYFIHGNHCMTEAETIVVRLPRRIEAMADVVEETGGEEPEKAGNLSQRFDCRCFVRIVLRPNDRPS
jgi:hypothetical protein